MNSLDDRVLLDLDDGRRVPVDPHVMNRILRTSVILLFMLMVATCNAAQNVALGCDGDDQKFAHGQTMTKTPEQVINQQLCAYNAGDIDAFMETFHPEIKVYRYPNELRFDNKADKRAAYKKLFDTYPDNYAEIVERMTLGNFVIDKERVTGRGDAPPMYVIAMYEIKDELIYRVHFLRDE